MPGVVLYRAILTQSLSRYLDRELYLAVCLKPKME
jgi:hypothetical protein